MYGGGEHVETGHEQQCNGKRKQGDAHGLGVAAGQCEQDREYDEADLEDGDHRPDAATSAPTTVRPESGNVQRRSPLRARECCGTTAGGVPPRARGR